MHQPVSTKMAENTSTKIIDQAGTLMCRQDGQCIFGRKDVGIKEGPSIQCLFCMEWFHEKCVNYDPDIMTLLACLDCRKMPVQIMNMTKDLQFIQGKLNRRIQEIENKLSEKEGQCDKFIDEIFP